MNPTVTLLVPTYNRQDLLAECLDSALAQTMPDLEVVVVDGASTDGTWEVCQRYAAADTRVRIFRDRVNSGPVLGWWRCIEEARGTYATFLWSDDMLMPTFLATTLPALERADVALVFTAAEIGLEYGQGSVAYAQPSRLIPSVEFMVGSLSSMSAYPVSPACALFRLSDLRASFTRELPTTPTTDLTATGAGTDVLLYLRTAFRYRFVACISEPLAFFRAHPGSITIQGRGGQVALHYALAKGWFAATNGFENLATEIFAGHWLSEMRRTRQLVSPLTAAHRYRNLVRPSSLATAALAQVVAKAATSIAARVDRVWPR